MLSYYILSAVLGLVFGSYITMASHRLAIDEGQGGRSKCPSCDHALGFKDLIPVLSYIMLKGRCRYCSALIGHTYPLIELFTMIGFIINYHYTMQDGLIITGLLDLVFVQMMVIVASDVRYKIIPDLSLIWLAALLIIYGYFSDRILFELLAVPVIMLLIALIVKYPMEWLLKRPALGMGDVKFFAVAGLALPATLLASFLVLSGVFGLCFGIVWRIIKGEPTFPFGPALCASLYYVMLTKQDIVSFLV